jgi:hypothetical protein
MASAVMFLFVVMLLAAAAGVRHTAVQAYGQ